MEPGRVFPSPVRTHNLPCTANKARNRNSSANKPKSLGMNYTSRPDNRSPIILKVITIKTLLLFLGAITIHTSRSNPKNEWSLSESSSGGFRKRCFCCWLVEGLGLPAALRFLIWSRSARPWAPHRETECYKNRQNHRTRRVTSQRHPSASCLLPLSLLFLPLALLFFDSAPCRVFVRLDALNPKSPSRT